MARKKVDLRVIAHSRSRQAVRGVLSKLRTYRKGARKSLHELLDMAISQLTRAVQADAEQRAVTVERRLNEAIDLIEDVMHCLYTSPPVQRRLEAMKQQLADSLVLRGMLTEGIQGVDLSGVTPGELKAARGVARRTKAKAAVLRAELRELEHQIAAVTHLADGMQWFLEQTTPRKRK